MGILCHRNDLFLPQGGLINKMVVLRYVIMIVKLRLVRLLLLSDAAIFLAR